MATRERKRNLILAIILVIIIILIIFIYILSNRKNILTKEPITLNIWHVYGEQTDSPLNELIDTFNNTVGNEEGINIQVSVVSDTNLIHDAILSSANKEPGASELPDLFISYPKTILAMPDKDIMVDFKDYFSEEELSEYIPEFVEEGMIDDKLIVFPVAKSTEIMFINKTLFDRFANETGASLEELNTWEGVFDLSKKYYDWTDNKTPNVAGDGKTFFVHDYHFDYTQVGVESLGESFFENDKIVFGDTFNKVWTSMADAASYGGIWLQDGHATGPIRTGDAIVSIASSASVLYYEDIVTYQDNSSEPIEVIARPVPVFENGKKMVMQRGAGFCLVKSNPERERAASVFVKWLTEPETNVKFVTSVGYMPVTQKAFDLLPEAIDSISNPKYQELYKAFVETQKDYEFYVPPKISAYLDYETKFEKYSRSLMRDIQSSSTDKEQLIKESIESMKDYF